MSETNEASPAQGATLSALLYCPRCGLPVDPREVGRATIDGEAAHMDCTLDELDEAEMDDFHN